MASRPTITTRGAVQQLRLALEKWRREYSAPTAIPDEIWSRAARLAAEQGVGTVARELGLHYGKLKRLTEALGPNEGSAESSVTFVEVRPALVQGEGNVSASSVTCVLELESCSGSRMRANLIGASPLDLAVMFREYSR